MEGGRYVGKCNVRSSGLGLLTRKCPEPTARREDWKGEFWEAADRTLPSPHRSLLVSASPASRAALSTQRELKTRTLSSKEVEGRQRPRAKKLSITIPQMTVDKNKTQQQQQTEVPAAPRYSFPWESGGKTASERSLPAETVCVRPGTMGNPK